MIPSSELLTRLAKCGERSAGSDTIIQARNLLQQQFSTLATGRNSCYEESFSIPVNTDTAATVCSKQLCISGRLLEYTGSIGTSVTAPLVYARNGSLRDFTRKPIAGAIVACRNNLPNHRFLQIQRALRFGAKGVILISAHDSMIQTGAGGSVLNPPIGIPAVAMCRNDWRSLRIAAHQPVTISYNGSIIPAQAINLCLDIAGCSPLKTIVVGAHYDSWYEGAQDNASGVAIVLALAHAVAARPTRNNVRCILFDAEERGMAGSFHHVTNNDISRYAAYLNLEMPLPVSSGGLRAVLYSRRTLVSAALPRLAFIRRGYIPVPLEWYYRFCPVFPADVHSFVTHSIPSFTTYCANAFLHTDQDTVARLRLNSFEPFVSIFEHFLRVLDESI